MTTPPERLDVAHVVVESVSPAVDGGRFAAKATVGSPVEVRADVFSHGHESVRAHLRHRAVGSRRWATVPMAPIGNDRFAARLTAEEPGSIEFEVLGELDVLGGWRRDARRRADARAFDPDDPGRGSELLARFARRLASSPSRDGAGLVRELAHAVARASGHDELAAALDSLDDAEDVLRLAPPGRGAVASPRHRLLVSRALAGCSAWYECFPRSASPDPTRPGTLRDLVGRLDYVAAMGFDVLYLPPVHPIGRTARKGPGNSPVAGPGDPGSPWAIGSASGGHESVAPELGTLEDLDALVVEARSRGMEVALDLAFQCSPDHPWVEEHPDWFAHRPDGTIACAENPPKRYEDIYPLDFDTADRSGLYDALLGVVRHWVGHGIRIFRVDNPHTKPFAFWEWLLESARAEDPGLVFLSEAFTRPKVMHRLAKLGFDQSYTYFTWRETKEELTDYFEDLAHGPGSTYLRPNAWPNTPDICATSLQSGGRASFVARLVLAACLSANYGIYGPPFELLLDEPAVPGTDGDYSRSEKYEVRHWDLDDPRSIADVVTRVNSARRAHRAFALDASLRFHRVDNDRLLCWSKHDEATGDAVVCVVSLDSRWPQSGFLELDLSAVGLAPDASFTVHDHLDGAIYSWSGGRNFVLLDPSRSPAHVFSVSASHDSSATGPDPSRAGATAGAASTAPPTPAKRAAR